MVTRTLSLLGVLLAVAAPCVAQSPGAFEIGGFARYSFYDNDLNLKDKVGGGGFLGIFFARNVALEAEAATTSTSDTNDIGNISDTPIRGRLVLHLPLRGWSSAIRLGAGYVHEKFGKDADASDDGITGLLGLRFGLNKVLALQVDGTLDYVPSPKNSTLDNYMNLGVQAGALLLLNNKYDRDKDGVEDGGDKCLGTPVGEAVDASGCSASQRDTDKDGVKDNADKCPNTAGGAKVDANGCAPEQLDKDHDGVIDNIDKCADTPAGEPADHDGCSASQKDTDGDGVKDNLDQCADTPAGAKVDAKGCIPDTDADGVNDEADKCPDTPNGQAVDATGCPQLFQGAAKTIVLPGVTFASGKSTLSDESKAALVETAKALAANPEVRVEVAGHTDNSGSRKSNLKLSASRAKSVEDFLEANGASPGQVTSHGYGPDKPIASNKTAEGRAQNRRVELTRLN